VRRRQIFWGPLFHVNLLEFRILWWLLGFWKICAPLSYAACWISVVFDIWGLRWRASGGFNFVFVSEKYKYEATVYENGFSQKQFVAQPVFNLKNIKSYLCLKLRKIFSYD